MHWQIHTIQPRSFVEGDLVLLYDQAKDKLVAGKLEPMWLGPYIVKRVLQKGAYELIDYEGNPLDKPRNGLYLKKYYAWFRAPSLYIHVFLESVLCAYDFTFCFGVKAGLPLIVFYASCADV